MRPMLARLLKQPILADNSARSRREATVLPFDRARPATPVQVDWQAKYPCTRMHGAAFEAELHPASDEQS